MKIPLIFPNAIVLIFCVTFLANSHAQENQTLKHDAPEFTLTLPEHYETYAAPQGFNYAFRRSLANENGDSIPAFSLVAVALTDSPVTEDEVLPEGVESALVWKDTRLNLMKEYVNIGDMPYTALSVDLPVAKKAVRLSVAFPVRHPDPEGTVEILKMCVANFEAEKYLAPPPPPESDSAEEDKPSGLSFKKSVLIGLIIGLIAFFTFRMSGNWKQKS